ncbi:hypothetical protein ACET3Z_010323 [Daucus carota]|nr:PREDICTED: uncharacterized protein LOC108198997 [Daucus carota subsp. sativus]
MMLLHQNPGGALDAAAVVLLTLFTPSSRASSSFLPSDEQKAALWGPLANQGWKACVDSATGPSIKWSCRQEDNKYGVDLKALLSNTRSYYFSCNNYGGQTPISCSILQRAFCWLLSTLYRLLSIV